MSGPLTTPDSRFAPTLGRIQRILLDSGITHEQLEEVVEDVSSIGAKVLISPESIVNRGHAMALSEAADLLLIGYLTDKFAIALPSSVLPD